MLERRHQQFSVETYALFPKSYFLENLATRSDGSILVSAPNHKRAVVRPRRNRHPARHARPP